MSRLAISQAISQIVALASLGLLATNAGAQNIHCYNDDNGRRVCSDRYVPEDARFDREIRNEQGILIRTEQGEITEDERAVIEAERAAEEQRAREAEERGRYNQMVLDSFTSVEGIESARDRMLEQIEGQITVIELFLSNLDRKLTDLERSAQRFSPYNENENAPPLPENLSLDIEQTRSSITRFKQRLDESLRNQEETRQEYQRHIDTFRELKGLDA